ncbi:hypothetical protein AB0J20_01460 [Micromonospora costi]|uniref:hypothetical protein n=1 Tax=Micromonospora costi TaxID=1530042 RepID=UPI0033C7C231
MPPEHRHTPDRLHRRLVPAVALLLLAPWAAECSWGGFTLADTPFVVLVLAPMYGGAALLIRETARRLGLGWPAIALLAAAFGVVQAGLVDQSLFNPGFLDDTEFADTRAAAEATLVPGLGFSARQAFDYVGNHVVLSICAPIAIVESYLGAHRRPRPWLGRPGLAVVALLYLAGSLLVFADDGGRKNFLASPVQLTAAAGVAVALIAAAVLTRRRPAPSVVVPPQRPRPAPATAAPQQTDGEAYERRAPHPLWPAVVVLLAYACAGLLPGWPGVAVGLALAATAATVLVVWSRRAGWGQRHVLAAGTASLLVAAAQAYLVPTYAPATPAAALAGDVAVSVMAVTFVGGAAWRLRRPSPTVHVRAS